MIHYSYPLYRPPAEADNIIVQVTYGCSYNNCSFCSMYKTKSYQVRPLIDVYRDIDILALRHPDATKIFFADGDALSLPTQHLIALLQYSQKLFPKMRRVSLYASAQNIAAKTSKELKLLQENKLTLLYYGIETGSNLILKKITKGVDQEAIIATLNKATMADMKVSATLILGLGGKKYSKEHIQESAHVINNTQVTYLSTLQLGLEEDAKENFFKHFCDYEVLNDYAILQEQREFLELLNPSNKIIFRSNHASNAFHLAGTLPKDKQRLLDELTYALNIGQGAFIAKAFRGF